MTVVDEVQTETTEGKRGRKRDLDFSKFRDNHQELADYINTHSGLEPITPNQVKALLTLKQDWAATPEQEAKRAEAKAARAAVKAKYDGLTPEQIKVEKAVDRANKQAEKLRLRLEEALAKAQRIREGTEATGEDLAVAVEAEQNGAEESSGRRFGRKR
jgi:hypothetical protein